MDNNSKNDLTLREMKRKSLDTIKVKNPTEKDFIVMWDSIKWLVPAKGENVFPRYLARHYVEKMTVQMINERNEEMLAKAKKKYNGSDWYKEEERIAYRTNDPNLIKEYFPMLWGGVTREYGLDVKEVVKDIKAPSGKSVFDDLLDEYEESLDPNKPEDKINTKHPGAAFEEQIVE